MKDIIEQILGAKRRHILLVASAGSGKTSTLISVLSEKIKRGIINPDDEKIIVFTFTNKAAEELMVRLSKFLGNRQDVLNKIYVGTIHAWCKDYLNSNGMLSNTKIIDELERLQLLQRIYPLLGINDIYEGKNKFEKIDKFEADLEFFHNEALSIDDSTIPDKIRSCLKRYLEFMDSQRLMDFGLLITKAIYMLTNEKEGEKVYHVFADEYQDVNPAQVKLIKKIVSLHPKSTILAVGDPRQTIYQWRGSDIRRILEFSKDFDDVEPNPPALKVNHRSRSGIIDFANIVARDMHFESPIPIEDMEKSPERADSDISVINYSGPEEHEEIIAKIIEELVSDGINYGDIAVLMRSVMPNRWTSESYAQRLMNLLDEKKIPYYSPNKNSGTLFVEEFMGSIIRMMELISDDLLPRNREEEKEFVNEINFNLDRIKKYCKGASREDIHYALAEWYKEMTTPVGKDKRGNEIYKNESYNFRKQFFKFCSKVGFVIQPYELPLQEGFSAVTQIMRAIEEIYRRRFRDLSGLRESPIEVFTRSLNWHLTHQLERWTEVGMDVDVGDRVTISTIHAAKGLEWPIVFVPFLWEGRFPLKDSTHKTSFPDDIASRYGTNREDEKRLWYVAVTRARDRLYFFSNCPHLERDSPFAYNSKFDGTIPTMMKTSKLTGNEKLSVVQPHTKEKYFHIGVSDFLLLLECPYHFYLRRLKGIDVPVGEEFGAGNVVHKIIERIATDSSKIPFLNIIDEEVYLPLAEYDMQENIKKSISKKIKRLIDSGVLEDIDNTEFPFSFRIGNLLVTGIVDATRKTEQGIEIIDWKSSVHEEFKERYENQILVYTAALRMLGYIVNNGILYDLSQENVSDGRIDVDINPRRIEILLEKAKANTKKIERNFVYGEPNEKSCRICDVKQICPVCYHKI